ncbi:hypothetical protein ACC862_37495, partial [Rhizobium ruizarguesonis]
MAIFGFLYVGICLALGLFLAILLDHKIRGEGLLRPIFLYPMALSFIVTGVDRRVPQSAHRRERSRPALGDDLRQRLPLRTARVGAR